MNIIVMGAGAIGSLFGGLLSKNNNVTLIGRKPHIETIKKNGLTIKGKTKINKKIPAETTVGKIKDSPDLILLTVKSYDTEKAVKQVKKIMDKQTILLSLQNGLGNIETISRTINKNKVFAGVTTHGATFQKPGVIKHTGKGYTKIGPIKEKNQKKAKEIVKLFNNAGIKTEISQNIIRQIWIKTIINSSINPLTTFFQCKNGYILKNPILELIMEKICKESTTVVNKEGIKIANELTLEETRQVIKDTADNYSSMLQSVQQGKKSEINSINGKIVEIGKKFDVDVTLNDVLFRLIK